MRHVLPTIQHLPTTPMMEEVIQPPDVEGYKPLQCIQEPGDILFLPSSWQHQTLNIGEAIGLGGQASWDPDILLSDKYEMVKESLARSPNNVNFHRIQLMTVFSYAEFEQSRLEQSMGDHQRVWFQLRPIIPRIQIGVMMCLNILRNGMLMIPMLGKKARLTSVL